MSQTEPTAPESAVPLLLVPWAPPTRERHLIDAVTRVHGERDEAGVLLAAVQAIEREVAAGACAVFQVEPDAQVVSLRAAGPRWRTAERETPTWLTGQTGGIAGFARGGGACAGRWVRRPGALADDVGSDIARVRIMLGDELWGMLVVVRPSSEDDRSEDAWFIESLAGQVGLALRHVTERAEAQRAVNALRDARNRATRDERLAMLGHIASSVAHDFNNALTSVLGVTEWLLFSRTDDEDLVHDLESVRQSASAAAGLVRRLYYFGKRKGAVPRETVLLSDVAETSLDLVRSHLAMRPDRDEFHVHLALETEAQVWVEADPTALREVFLALLTNAVDASRGGGDVVVRVGREGHDAFAAVVDHGEGMDETVRGRVFEPFFTTKSSHGAGLGLPLCWSVVASHDGRIDVASTRGVGSTFTVWLPATDAGAPFASTRDDTSAAPVRAAAEARPARPVRPATQEPGPAAQRILIVDDQADVRASVADMLGALGYLTETVGSGRDALRLADTEDFDLVITDLGMPGLSGLDVARSLHRDHPGLPVLLLTGWGTHFEGRPPADIARVVAKPVSLDVLREVLRDVLGPTPGGA